MDNSVRFYTEVSRIAEVSRAGDKRGHDAGPGRFAGLEDPDGNEIYLWEVNREAIPETELEHAGKA